MSNAIGCGFDHRSGQTKDYEIGMCSFSTKSEMTPTFRMGLGVINLL
jgi:hypothetical protein